MKLKKFVKIIKFPCTLCLFDIYYQEYIKLVNVDNDEGRKYIKDSYGDYKINQFRFSKIIGNRVYLDVDIE